MFMKSLNESSSLAISCLVMLGFGIPKISWASLVVAAAVDTSGGQNHNVGGTLDDAWSKNMLLRSLAILYCSLGQRGGLRSFRMYVRGLDEGGRAIVEAGQRFATFLSVKGYMSVKLPSFCLTLVSASCVSSTYLPVVTFVPWGVFADILRAWIGPTLTHSALWLDVEVNNFLVFLLHIAGVSLGEGVDPQIGGAIAWDGEGVARVGEGEEGVLVGGAEPGDPSLAGGPVLPMKLRVCRLGICLLVSLQLLL